MARTVSFSTVREAIRTRYDLPAFSTTTFVTTALVNSLINEELQRYYGLLLECFGDDYLDATQSLTTSAGVGLTSLPDGFAKLRRLAWVRGADDVVLLRRASAEDIGLADYDAKSWSEYTPHYRIQGQTIAWYPPPSAEYNVTATYAALPADLTSDGDTFMAGPGFEGFVIYGVCASIALREEKDPGSWLALRNDAEKRIRDQARERDESEGYAVRDVCYGGIGDRERFNRWTFE